MGEITIRKIEYKGWKNCIEITNGIIDLIATTDVGPRIIGWALSAVRMNLWNSRGCWQNRLG
jgi:hypothetical protein